MAAIGCAIVGFGADIPTVKDLPVRVAMPDPLVAEDGGRITTPEQWQKRRKEMQRILEEYEFGHMPPPPGNVEGQELKTEQLQGGVAYRVVHLTFGPGKKLGFDIGIFTPGGGFKKPLPVIVHLTYTAGEDTVSQYAEALSRGYAVAQILYQQLGADNPGYRQTAFFPAYPDYDWNDFAAWAWGVSRCVDYLEQDPAMDGSKIIAVGVSRTAQAIQLAGAMDDRIALVGAAGAGCAFRYSGNGRGGKQGLDEVVDQCTYWFGPRLPEFRGQIDRLPFDQHWLLALVAPRSFILCDALDDQYCGANAAVQSYLAAKPTYAMLGVPERLGIHFRPGKHGMEGGDWGAILDFSDKVLRKRDVGPRFDELPPADQLH